jgi:hypothetical protein
MSSRAIAANAAVTAAAPRPPPARAANANVRRRTAEDVIAPATFRGTLDIRSSPVGARVFINGAPAGTTPLLLENVRIGSRAVRLELDGYEAWSGLVRVVANQRARTTAVMRRSPGG